MTLHAVAEAAICDLPENAPLMMLSLAGTLSPAGQGRGGRTWSVAGALAPAGAMHFRIPQVVGGTLTPAGALGTVRVFLQALAGALSLTGGLSRRVSKALAGFLSPAGRLLRNRARPLIRYLRQFGVFRPR